MTTLIENAVTYVPAVPLHLKKEPTRFFFLRKILNKFLLRIPYNTDKKIFVTILSVRRNYYASNTYYFQ